MHVAFPFPFLSLAFLPYQICVNGPLRVQQPGDTLLAFVRKIDSRVPTAYGRNIEAVQVDHGFRVIEELIVIGLTLHHIDEHVGGIGHPTQLRVSNRGIYSLLVGSCAMSLMESGNGSEILLVVAGKQILRLARGIVLGKLIPLEQLLDLSGITCSIRKREAEGRKPAPQSHERPEAAQNTARQARRQRA